MGELIGRWTGFISLRAAGDNNVNEDDDGKGNGFLESRGGGPHRMLTKLGLVQLFWPWVQPRERYELHLTN